MALCHMNSQGEEKEKIYLSFDTWQGEMMCLKYLFFSQNFDVAPLLAKKHRNETSVPDRVPRHVNVVVSDQLQSVINQNVIAHTDHNQLCLWLVLQVSWYFGVYSFCLHDALYKTGVLLLSHPHCVILVMGRDGKALS